MATESSHFWLGTFKTEKEFFDFFGEDQNYYSDKEDDNDEKYISEFAKSQGEYSVDHDFMECGFENDQISFEEKFSKYSYSSQWLAEAQKRLQNLGLNLEDINAAAFITSNEIKKPISIKNTNFNIIYIGEIEYEI
ncbi:immunity 22 family protein [Flavobacterium hungaricum]|uniref:Immunity protein 22 n=1 Tax=Flavobacterium hungaricum TaxID=2082725 RepID=A0ABR9TIJ1_9FLAO|nr:immunity 22 family protein [Flavobacterium hungaricum]MBE8725171.1 hypothetical protein [Flavobacterium hungaricum]